MHSILIADCLSVVNNKGSPVGHYIYFNKDMYRVLKEQFKVVVACSAEYSHHIEGKTLLINPSITVSSKKFYRHFVSRYILFSKVIKVLKSGYKNIIIQQAFLPIVLIGLLFTRTHDKKVYIFIYSDILNGRGFKKRIYRLIYKLAYNKISGIITTMPELAYIYQKKSLIISDYFNRKIKDKSKIYTYDIGVLGLINKWKDVEAVVAAFMGTKFKVLIAGFFSSNERYTKLSETIKSCKNITLINKYLEENEYEKLLMSSKYILLPYNNVNYRSSGVFFEALYGLKPLIVSSAPPFFKAVNDKGLGYQYSKSPIELFDKLNDNRTYDLIVENIKNFLEEKDKREKERILSFFCKEILK